MPIVS